MFTKDEINASSYKPKSHELDMMVLKLEHGQGTCDLIELKSGDTFDGKKSDGEKESLYDCREELKSKLPFELETHFSFFHADSDKKVKDGVRKRFSEDEVMTGRKLCETLDINYDDVVAEECAYQKENMKYVIETVAKIAERWNSHNN